MEWIYTIAWLFKDQSGWLILGQICLEFNFDDLPILFYLKSNFNYNLSSTLAFKARININPNKTLFKYFNLSLKRIFVSISLLLSIANINELNTKIVNKIIGNKSYLLLSDGKTNLTYLNELFSFKIPKQDGYKGME